MEIFRGVEKLTFYEDLKAQLTKGVFQANYKPKVICHLLSSDNFTDTRENLCKALSRVNPDKPHPYFMKHNTVFDVLCKRLGLIVKIESSYKLKGSLTEDQVKTLKKICKEKLGEWK
jgi:hypothetical protein